MLLVADSGSTKCDWILVKPDGERIDTHTMGFNPFFHNEEIISSEILKNELLAKNADKIEYISFYQLWNVDLKWFSKTQRKSLSTMT
jgi:hypothetical protein